MWTAALSEGTLITSRVIETSMCHETRRGGGRAIAIRSSTFTPVHN